MATIAALEETVKSSKPAVEVASTATSVLAAPGGPEASADRAVQVLLATFPSTSAQSSGVKLQATMKVRPKQAIGALKRGVDAINTRNDKDSLGGHAGALLKRIADLYVDMENEEEGGSDDDLSEDDPMANIRARLKALRDVDVAKTYSLLARVASDGLVSADEFKMKHHVDVAQSHFQLGDADAAQTALYGIQSYSSANITPWTLVVFRSCFAETLFKRGDYLKASSYFLAVANTEGCGEQLTPAHVESSLHKSAIACFLAPVTRQQTQQLHRILAHPRSPSTSLYSILRKLCSGDIVKAEDLESFKMAVLKLNAAADEDEDDEEDEEAGSSPKTKTEAGTAVYDETGTKQVADFRKAAITHNVQAAGKMFRNITLARLATVCGISSADEALSLVSGMVSKGLVEATIDQAGGLVEFASAVGLAEAHHAAAVRAACHTANDLFFDIQLLKKEQGTSF